MRKNGVLRMKGKKSQAGFTLIEIVIVIVLISILVSIAVANYVNLSNEAKAATCKANQLSVESAQRIYYSQHYLEGNACYASTLDELLPIFTRVTPPKCPDEKGIIQLLPDGTATCTLNSHKRLSTN